MTPHPRPVNSCSTSSAPSRTSNAGSSPSVPATASPRPGNAGEHRADRRSTRRRFPPPRNSSRPDCHPLEPQNSLALAGQRLTESQRRCVEVETEALRSLRVILRTNLAMTPASGAMTCWCLRKWPIRPTRASSSFRRKKNPRRSPNAARSGGRWADPRRSPILRRGISIYLESSLSRRCPLRQRPFEASAWFHPSNVPMRLVSS